MSIKSYQKNGKTHYRVHAYIGTDPLTGKQKIVKRSGFKTQKDAKIAEVKLIKDGFDKSLDSLDKETITFKKVYDMWIVEYKETVKPGTYALIQGQFKNHILPHFSDFRIAKITPAHCNQFIQANYKKFANNKFLRADLNHIFRYAIKMGMIVHNPITNINVPKLKKIKVDDAKTVNYWEAKQLNIFLNKAKKVLSAKWYAYMRLLAYTGMRRGEALALNWSDIDFKNKTISVDKTTTLKKEIVLPKSQKSIRTITIDDGTIDILKHWKSMQIPSIINDIIFTNTNNEHITASMPKKKFDKVLDQLDLPRIKLHGLRHTHCSLLFESGASLQEVQDRLGHSDVKTTLSIYTHVMEGRKRDVANEFNSYLNEIG